MTSPVIAIAGFDPELMAVLAEEVTLVELELEGQVGSQVRLVREVCAHTLHAGGKRLRPALVTLAARATARAFRPERTRKLGACMEMIHMATLLHDDVIDRAETRRGARTASAAFGNTASILSGDVLLSKAMAILAEDGDLAIIRNVSRAVVDLAEGEVAELEARGRFDLTRNDHFDILRRKTATFIQSCCEVGALAADAPVESVEALGQYGFRLGMAFQIVDDLLDYRAEATATGKPRATDFREGCPTLPLICLSARLSADELEIVRAKFGNGVSDEEMRTIVSWMETGGAFAEAELEAQRRVDDALKALQALPRSPNRSLLEAVAAFVVSRES